MLHIALQIVATAASGLACSLSTNPQYALIIPQVLEASELVESFEKIIAICRLMSFCVPESLECAETMTL